MKIAGKIEKVNQNSKNPKVFSVLVEGDWFGIFEPDGECRFKEGDFINEEFEINGKFKNLKLGPKDVNDSEEKEKYHIKDIGAESKYDKRDDEKIRSMALSYSKDIVVAMLANKNTEGDLVAGAISGAKKFYEYIKNG